MVFSQRNPTFIRHGLNKHFVVALKANRTAALRDEARGMDFPVFLVRQAFRNKDGSTGVVYLACSDLNGNGEGIIAIYQRRWKVETYHKTLKSHASLAKSPTKTVRTQSNHCFPVSYAARRLSWLSVTDRLNYVALRTRLYLRGALYLQ